jgi:putative YhbY family RNA-binding protein
MIEITPQQRRALRAQAHHLHPVVIVGQAGLSAQVTHEIDVALRAHGLVKVRVFSNDRAEREAMLAQIARELEAAPVQHLGKLLILWRPQEEADEAKKPAKPARKRAATKTAPREKPRPVAPVARRARGGASPAGERDASNPRRARPSAEPSAFAQQREPRGKSAPNPRRRRRAS